MKAQTDAMDIIRHIVVFDAADIETESAFWAALVGGTVVREDGWNNVLDQRGDCWIAVQWAPDHVPPHWPDGQPQQVHIDFHVGDIAAAHDEALAAGAKPLGAIVDRQVQSGFQIYASTAGHPFCLCWG